MVCECRIRGLQDSLERKYFQLIAIFEGVFEDTNVGDVEVVEDIELEDSGGSDGCVVCKAAIGSCNQDPVHQDLVHRVSILCWSSTVSVSHNMSISASGSLLDLIFPMANSYLLGGSYTTRSYKMLDTLLLCTVPTSLSISASRSTTNRPLCSKPLYTTSAESAI